MVMQLQVALWVELLAAGLGGLQGALFAAESKDRRLDLLGVLVVGLTVALGGSVLRDVLLDEPPAVLGADWYLAVAAVSALVGMVLQPVLTGAGWLLTGLDAVVMGLFAAIGASKALALDVSSAGAVVVGIVGAIGGGVLRDLLLDRPISVLHVGTLYAVAAGAGAGVMVLLVGVGTSVPVAGAISTAVAAVIRVAAVALTWTFPELRSPRSSSRTP